MWRFVRWTLLVLLAACGLKSRPVEPIAGGGTEEDAGVEQDAGIAVDAVAFDWTLRGSKDEYSIASAASGTHILWLRYVLGASGVITALRKSNGMLVSTLPHDLAPLNVVSHGDQVAFIG